MTDISARPQMLSTLAAAGEVATRFEEAPVRLAVIGVQSGVAGSQGQLGQSTGVS